MAPYQDAQDHQLLNQLFALESRVASVAGGIWIQMLKPRPFKYKQSDLAGIPPSNSKKLRLLSQLAGIPPANSNAYDDNDEKSPN